MGKYQGYGKYKDSGVEWLGEIPEHWDIWKVTHGFKNVGSGTTPKSDNSNFYDGDIPWITTSELRETLIEDTSQKLTQEALKNYSALKLYPKGSIAIAMYGATIGRLGILGIDATVNQACCVFSESKIFHLPFFYYWLWMHRPNLIALSAGGGQPNLSQDDLKQLRLLTPSLEEQEKIARFLDYKTKQIDELIAKKEALLEKLDEKRTALISHAVTKGLDPNVPMKDSGIEWLGEIPQHWEVKRTKFLVTKIGSGKTPKGGSEIYVDSGVMLIRSQNVYDEGLRLDDVVYIDDEIDTLQANSRVFPNDILLNITGASIGRVGLVPPNLKKANVNQHVCIFRPNFKEILPQYLHLLLCSQQGKEQIFSYENGTSREGLNFQQAGNLTFAIPSTDIQKQITEYLYITTAKLDQQKAKIQKAIELLKEYRTALITNAVTGKIDVRQVPIP